MEFNKFIQEDIIEFLDKKSEFKRENLSKIREEEMELFNIEKDYAKETQKALENDNITKAKRIFNELRNYYNNLKDNSEEKERVYSILEEVYAKIKKYFSTQNNGLSLVNELGELTRTTQNPQPTQEQINDSEKKQSGENEKKTKNEKQEGTEETKNKDEKIIEEEIKKKKSLFEEQAIKDQEKIETLEQRMNYYVNEIIKSIHNSDLKKAIMNYKRLRKTFSDYPADDKFRKIEWYNRIIYFYNMINSLKEKLLEEHKNKKTKNNSLLTSDLQKSIINNLKETIKAIINSLDEKNIIRAESLMIDARRDLASIDKKHSEAKEKFDLIISKLNHRIQFLKKHPYKKNNEGTTEKLTPEKRAEAEQLYQEGLKLQNNNKLEEAGNYYSRVLKINPHHLAAKIRLERIIKRRPNNQENKTDQEQKNNKKLKKVLMNDR